MMMEMESDERRQHLDRQAAARILAVMKDTEAMSDTYRQASDEMTHRIGGADHAPRWAASSTVDGKACSICYEQALASLRGRSPYVLRALTGTLPPKVLA